MTGTYAGATLAIRKGDLDASSCAILVGHSNGAKVSGCESVADDRNVPCREDYRGYCKLSDDKINALKATSPHTDPYIIQSYKSYDKSIARIAGGSSTSSARGRAMRGPGPAARTPKNGTAGPCLGSWGDHYASFRSSISLHTSKK